MHTIDIFSQTTSHKNLVILASIGVELARGGGADYGHLPGRVILNPIPGRRLNKFCFLSPYIVQTIKDKTKGPVKSLIP